eukprot:scaffold120559_cov20-Tisochrysis_lutea.AAC.1
MAWALHMLKEQHAHMHNTRWCITQKWNMNHSLFSLDTIGGCLPPRRQWPAGAAQAGLGRAAARARCSLQHTEQGKRGRLQACKNTKGKFQRPSHYDALRECHGIGDDADDEEKEKDDEKEK